MSFDRILAFVVVGLTCLLIGGVGGLLFGAASEQGELTRILGRANLTPDCQKQIDAAFAGAGAPPQ
jgi:hypothetical protein